MSCTDPVADLLTAIRNANQRLLEKVVVPHSNLKERLLSVLKEEGFLSSYKIVDDPKHGPKKRELHVYLKYGPDRERVIRHLERVSKPGRRIFVQHDEIPKVQDGFGVAILSTPKGVLSSRRARASRTGGELLCKVW
jgi:small subunit ribosomal protein S8